ncbi:hypothetical protein [Pleurocapsa sp. FMAR1]|uniref:hypothetical protein n=1 Tax=Pleurocapsa sp. FMAR1 TaxID=3040204 RepID=UPI0029C628D6|nr:hypothetical protein [Pleurocapsa sp. FMAR1]
MQCAIAKSSPEVIQEFKNLLIQGRNVDIINLGTAQMMMILIKIVLICPESKSDLEKRIALIASYYQLNAIQEIPWLFKTLEHLLIAFSIYFGNIDVSIAKSVVAK